MNRQSITGLRSMNRVDIEKYQPFELTSDGEVIAIVSKSPVTVEVSKPITGRTKCPNCKFVYDYTPDDGKPFFFSMKKYRQSKEQGELI